MCLTILVVEDHEAMRVSLRQSLSASFQGCQILEAADGQAGVDMALAANPDIVLMDIRMPKLNGLEALRRIKAAKPQLPVVMLSVLDAPQCQAMASEGGASAYVLKERAHRDLLSALRSVLPAESPAACRAVAT